jgi:ribosomal protein L40E
MARAARCITQHAIRNSFMATCPQCGTIHMPSARTCRKCGASLLPGEPKVVFPPEEPCPEPEGSLPEAMPAEGLEEPVLKLAVIGSGQRLHLQGKSEYVVGRTDPERGVVVDVDLTDHGAWDAGVSRRHARIFKQHGQFFIEDLRSANGTFLNEIRLEPGLSQALQSGDIIKLGVLRLYVDLC